MRWFSVRKTLLSIFSLIVIYTFPLFCDAASLKTAKTQNTSQEDFKNHLEEAVELINRGLYQEAERILLKFENDASWQDRVLFLLGRLYKEEGSFKKAEDYLIKAAKSYPLLKDYALKLLTDVYIAAEEFDKAIKAARRIKNTVLLQAARQSEIRALFALEKEEEVKEALFQYASDYPEEWDYKLALAVLLKTGGEADKAIKIFKDIYINAASLSSDALEELKALKADTLTDSELLERADNLYKDSRFNEAEAAYKEVVRGVDNSEMNEIRFAVGMCRFRLKQYNEAAKSFGLIKSPKALYWQARSFYRIDKIEEFDNIIEKFEKNYPRDRRLVKLLLISADDFRRAGNFNDAMKIFKKILDTFPGSKEDALWAIGWMNYTAGDYKTALGYFSKLTTYRNNRNYYKYIYWKARSLEKLTEKCLTEHRAQNTEHRQQTADNGQQNNVRVNLKSDNNEDVCPEENKDFFSKFPVDGSYYGHLIRLRSALYTLPDKVEVLKPAVPEGEVYRRVEALAFFGMRDEAVNEIKAALQRVNKSRDFLYLGYTAIRLDEYKGIIALAEKAKDNKFLPLSYPLGYREIIKQAAETENLDAYLVAALIREESRFDPMAVSWAGAVGLMQLMPSTAYRLKDRVKVDLTDGSELHDVKKNILLGTHYLSMLIKEFKKVPFALAAYNAGENALKDWLYRFSNKDIDEFIEEIPYRETRRYVKKVLKSYWQYRTINGLPIESY